MIVDSGLSRYKMGEIHQGLFMLSILSIKKILYTNLYNKLCKIANLQL